MTPTELLVYRRSLKMDQGAFGKAIGVSRQTVCNWEGGKFSIPSDLVERLATAGIGAMQAPASREASALAKRIAATYAHNRGQQMTHAEVLQAWHNAGVIVPREAMAIIVAEFPDILETSNQ